MNAQPDDQWHHLLLRSAPTFAGDPAPPYGFVTATLGRLRARDRQREEMEQIGWRALLTSFITLVAVASLTVGLKLHDRGELDPGLKSIIEVENIPVS